MKQKISYNSIVSGVTIAIFVAFVAIFVLFWVFINKPFDDVFFWILVGLFVLCFCCIFGSIPYSVDADDDYLDVRRPFHTRRYRYSDIERAESYDNDNYPKEYESGVRFHGRYKNPVVITLKNGKKYIIGSEDSKKFADYINGKIS
ncbi:MAG: hypothetical protein J1D77_06435 [Muribaculaceae bacterium]|nr:hypothetical protein [Muribaculaceae bacterium]